MSSSDHSEEFRSIEAEFRRIGLDPYELPGLAVSGPVSEFIEYLRSMPAGATWRELFPDLPENWIPGRPETWIDADQPRGPYDLEPEMDSNHDPRDDRESRPQVGFRLVTERRCGLLAVFEESDGLGTVTEKLTEHHSEQRSKHRSHH
jgi:hypothetical protein